jgi:hypothetical protein
VARLGAGEHLVLPVEVVDYLDHLRSLGVSERGVAMEREGWTVIAGRAPARAVEWTALKQEQLEDPQFRQLYLAFDRAFDLDPGDPALIDLAEAVCVFLSRMETELGGSDEAEISEHLAPLLDAWIIPASPAWRRLKTLIEQRGWRGWTQIERAAPQDR